MVNDLNKSLEFKEHLKLMPLSEKIQWIAEETYDNRKTHEEIKNTIFKLNDIVCAHETEIKLLKKIVKDNRGMVIATLAVVIGWIGTVIAIFISQVFKVNV